MSLLLANLSWLYAQQYFSPAQTPAATPPSFSQTLTPARTVTLPVLDMAGYLYEDSVETANARVTGEDPAYRTAIPQDVSLNFNSGVWEILPNGDRVWRLRIVSPGATDLCLRYDNWRLVKPCELWVYNDDHSSVLGPFTYIDNWDGTNATPFTKGETVTLEYRVPAGVEDIGELSISHVTHGYKNVLNRHRGDPLDNYGDSMPCEINVRCWPDFVEERACVAMIFAPTFGRWCSGAMLNNTLQDGAANFLTADHCWRGDVNNWITFWNYESPNCSPTADGQTNLTITNASVLARYALSDFLLIRLSRPRPDGAYIPRFMGWDRDDIASSQTWGIHHPAGDVKKISHDWSAPVNADWNGVGPNTHWKVGFDEGMTEGGSSGSPLFSTGSYVVGQLHGGWSYDCIPDSVIEKYYGKLSTSWTGDGTSSGRLRDWLDPNNSGVHYVNSWQPTGPPNDSCNQPGFSTITTLPFSQSGSTQFAANNFNTSNCNTNTSPELIYMLQLPCDHSVTVSTCGSSFDTQLMVYGATSCMSWQYLVGCNDDFCGTQSQVSFNASGGVLYVIVLEGYGSSYGNYVFNITGTGVGAQGNAQCPGYEITEVPYFTYGVNFCGNDDVNPDCQSNDSQDVHWWWHSPYNQAMRAKTCYINFDTILMVRSGTGNACGQYLVGCNDDSYCGSDALASSVIFDASANGYYYITMDGYNGATGMASLELEVYNDDCSSPIVVPSLPANYQGDTRPAGDDFATLVGPSSKEVFFQYTSPTCQTVGVSLCDDNYTNYDSYVEVRTGGPCPGSTVVAYNDDGCGNNGLKSWVNFSAEANRTYYIIVAGFGTAAGQFMAYFYNVPGTPAAPLADLCPGILIPSLPFTDYGNTNCMANNYFNCVGSSSKEMVYYFSRPTCERVTASLCGSGYDCAIGVYGGTCPNIAPLIVCNDDNYCGGVYTTRSTVTFDAQANTNYQILVHGFGANSGPYVLNVTSVPCPVAPQPVTDLVIRPAIPTQTDVKLHWSPKQFATAYRVYYSADQNNIVLPANLVATTTDTFAVISGIVSNPSLLEFFQVVAINTSLLAPPDDGHESRLDGMTKEMAEDGPIVQNPAFLMDNENHEVEVPGKVK